MHKSTFFTIMGVLGLVLGLIIVYDTPVNVPNLQQTHLNKCIDMQNAIGLKDKGFYFESDGTVVCQFYFPGKSTSSILVQPKDLDAFFEGYRFAHNRPKREGVENCIRFNASLLGKKIALQISDIIMDVCTKHNGYLMR